MLEGGRVAICFDIDGVLADSSQRAHHLRQRPPDWKSYRAAAADDAPITAMIGIVNALHAAGATIVLLTGRDETTRAETVEWLRSHGVQYHHLAMRPAADVSFEYDTKSNLIADVRDAGFNPAILFDDRDDAARAAIGQGILAALIFTP